MSAISQFLTDPTTQAFGGAVEDIPLGSIVKLDTASASIAAAVPGELLGAKVPTVGADWEALDASGGNQGNYRIFAVLDDDSVLVSLNASYNYLSGSAVYRISKSGEVTKLAAKPAGRFAQMADGRFLNFKNKNATTFTVEVFDENLNSLSGPTDVGTTVTSNPLSSSPQACETGGGQVILTWGYSSKAYYAVLNADLATMHTQPTVLQSISSSYTPWEMMRLADGRVVLLYSYYTGSSYVAYAAHFAADGTYGNKLQMSAAEGSNWTRNLAQSRARRCEVYGVEAAPGKVVCVVRENSYLYFCKLDVSTNTLEMKTAIAASGAELSWHVSGDYAYIYYWENGSYTITPKVVDLTANTVAAPATLGTIDAAAQYLEAALLIGDEVWLFSHSVSNETNAGKAVWVTLTCTAGAITKKFAPVAQTDVGRWLDLDLFAGQEIFYLLGGTSNGTSFVPLKMARIEVATGELLEPATTVRSTKGTGFSYSSVGNVAQKVIYRSRAEEATLIGFLVDGLAPAVGPQVLKVKPNSSIAIGVATAAAAAGAEVSVKLDGWVKLEDAYSTTFESIDHTAEGGNAFKIYGKLANLKGGF